MKNTIKSKVFLSVAFIFQSVSGLAADVNPSTLPTCNLITTKNIFNFIDPEYKSFKLVFNEDYSYGANQMIGQSEDDTKASGNTKIIQDYYKKSLRFKHLYDLTQEGYLDYATEADAKTIESSLILRNPYNIAVTNVLGQSVSIPAKIYNGHGYSFQKTSVQFPTDNSLPLKAIFYTSLEKAVKNEKGGPRFFLYDFETLQNTIFYQSKEFTFQQLAKNFLRSANANKSLLFNTFKDEIRFIAFGKTTHPSTEKYSEVNFLNNVNLAKSELIESFLLSEEVNQSEFLQEYKTHFPICK